MSVTQTTKVGEVLNVTSAKVQLSTCSSWHYSMLQLRLAGDQRSELTRLAATRHDCEAGSAHL
jgi:hypothetical protein